jgi:hypothetical protein
MSEYYVTVDTVEQDGLEWNHLLRLVIRGQEYLISATAPTALGQEGNRLWLTWSELECNKVTTIEAVGDMFVTGQLFLCTATDVRKT